VAEALASECADLGRSRHLPAASLRLKPTRRTWSGPASPRIRMKRLSGR